MSRPPIAIRELGRQNLDQRLVGAIVRQEGMIMLLLRRTSD
jgi:hypothetical protein